ncbi:MAG: 1,2-phenylacetyl-CoA epoxidase subunit PaaC [Anaerolineales bacterium]
MKAEIQDAQEAYLLAMADDELILGHRNSEWTGHAPILEEDIAFTNLALDELGHAQLWYGLLADLKGEDDSYPDQLVFYREAPAFRNVQLVELPNGDWARSMLRQYLFDAYEAVHLSGLRESKFAPLAAAAAKAFNEERYHLRHTRAWVRRLGLGTAESHDRMQAALEFLWPYVLQCFQPTPGRSLLVTASISPDPGDIQSAWLAEVEPLLTEADLKIPVESKPSIDSRAIHSEHLVSILTDMQYVARSYPGAAW